MQNENTVLMPQEPAKLESNFPTIETRPGFQTSSGQLTALFALVSVLLSSYLGYHITAEKMQTIYDAVVAVITIVGPLLIGSRVVTNFINSRGKIASNTINANAAIAINATKDMPQLIDGISGTIGSIADPASFNKVSSTMVDATETMQSAATTYHEIKTGIRDIKEILSAKKD